MTSEKDKQAAEPEHELKIWPEYFDDVHSGRKPFEVRKLDRLFGKGHILFLREWSPLKGYTGRAIRKRITYIMAGGQWGLAEGNCILGLEPLAGVSYSQKENAVEFKEWSDANYINYDMRDGLYYHKRDLLKHISEATVLTTKQLYNLFIESKGGKKS